MREGGYTKETPAASRLSKCNVWPDFFAFTVGIKVFEKRGIWLGYLAYSAYNLS
jgi:hypothetical protein